MAEVNETIHHIRAKGTLFEVEDQQARQSAGSTTAEKVIYEIKDPGTETEEVVSVKDKIEEIDTDTTNNTEIVNSLDKIIDRTNENLVFNSGNKEHFPSDGDCNIILQGTRNTLARWSEYCLVAGEGGNYIDSERGSMVLGNHVISDNSSDSLRIGNSSYSQYMPVISLSNSTVPSDKTNITIWADENSEPIDETVRRGWERAKTVWIKIKESSSNNRQEYLHQLVGSLIIIDESYINENTVMPESVYVVSGGNVKYAKQFTTGTILEILEYTYVDNDSTKDVLNVKVSVGNMYYFKLPKGESNSIRAFLATPSAMNTVQNNSYLYGFKESIMCGDQNVFNYQLDSNSKMLDLIIGRNNVLGSTNVLMFGNRLYHYGKREDNSDNYGQMIVGRYNDFNPETSIDDLLVLANGTSYKNKDNVFRVTNGGATYAKNAYNTTGADYAEYFEWLDGNQNKEDRVGFFVTLNGNKIIKADHIDYILGVVSGLPAIIGNSDKDWRGRWILDEFGRYVMEEIEETIEKEEEFINDKGEIDHRIVKETKKVLVNKLNPDYDPNQPYIPRKDRPEWSAVGMMGVLAVRDDGSCLVNGFCDPADGGIATAGTKYRVIERVSENVVKIIFK